MARIPNSVASVVDDVLGAHYYNHSRIERLFRDAGASRAPPDGNCAEKCRAWLRSYNATAGVDASVVLGRVLEAFMDYELTGETFSDHDWEKRREHLRAALARAGLEYRFGGTIVGHGNGPGRTLQQLVRGRDLAALDAELARALDALDADPPAALTAACAIVEAACKVYIEDEGLTAPKEQTVMPLWKVVRDHLASMHSA